MDKTIILLLVITIIKCEEIYENSTNLCQRCQCTETSEYFTLDCNNRQFINIIANWPLDNKTIKASFSNNLITTLEKLPESDAKLEITFSNCGIQYLYPGIFVNVKNVEYADFSYNLITSEELSSDKFKGPYSDQKFEPLALKHLNLAYNKVHSLNKNLFEHLPNLQYLNLEGNHFRVLDLQTQLALSSVTTLTSLNLANNQLTELVDEAIAKLKLTELNLSNNDLDFVPDSLVRVSDTLEKLILDNNPIIELVDDTFIGLKNIKELSINNLTELKYVNANAFVPMPKLNRLFFNNNPLLSRIDREAFPFDSQLKEFYLNNNNLFEIDSKLLRWSNLIIFEFSENPLSCSCQLFNITAELNSEIKRSRNGPRCFHPVSKQSVPVFTLNNDICLIKVNQANSVRTAHQHLTIIRIALIGLSIISLFAAFTAVALGYTRFRKHQRNVNYPFASQVFYNPLSTHPTRF